MPDVLLTYTKVFKDAEGRDVAKTYAKRSALSQYKNQHKWRITEEKDFKDLEQDLFELGDLSPILVNSGKYWGDPGETIGGNTRLKVYEKHKIDDIWVEVKSPKSEKDFIKLAATHNRNYSQWNPDALAELTEPYRGQMDIGRLGIQLAHTVSLESLHKSYAPDNTPGAGVSQDKPRELDNDAYQNATIKQITFIFPAVEYAHVISRLEKIARKTKKTSNTEIFLFLLDFYESQNGNRKA